MVFAGFLTSFVYSPCRFDTAGISHSPSNGQLLALAAAQAESNVLFLVQSMGNLAGLAGGSSNSLASLPAAMASVHEESSEEEEFLTPVKRAPVGRPGVSGEGGEVFQTPDPRLRRASSDDGSDTSQD